MDDVCQQVLDQLTAIKRLLSMVATKGMTQREQVASLSRVGFAPKEIAELLGTTGNTVNVTLAKLRKRVNEL
jgi:DNA-binding CsgD family transcriptional regulator